MRRWTFFQRTLLLYCPILGAMVIYPILGRELKRAARKPLLYWLRTGAVVGGVIVGIVLLHGTQLWQSGAAVGRELFRITIWAAFILCLLSGVLLTSTLLCEERREGSLALLFLTELKGFDVLLGKLGAIGLLACQIVLGLFPLIALCMVLGGVSLAEFSRAVQLLLVTLLFSLSVGLFVSALNKQVSRAVLLTFATVVLSTVLVFAADWMARSAVGPWPVGPIIPGLLPSMMVLLDPFYRLPPQSFEECLLYQSVLSIALLVLGGLMLKRLSIQDESHKPGPILLSRPQLARERRVLFRRNPIYWLGLRHRWRWLGTWLVFCFLLILWAAILHIFDFSREARLLAIFGMAPVLHLLLKIAIAAEAVERLGSARHGELELLLVTPVKGGQILHGHFKALARQFALPLITMIGIDVLFVFCYEPASSHTGANDSLVGYLFIYTLGISLLIDLPALIWRGLWNGLRCDNSVQALRRTLVEVVILPIPIFIGSLILPALIFSIGHEFLIVTGFSELSRSGGLVTGLILWWWLVAFICNTVLQQKARYQLKTWLRYIVADPPGERRRLSRRSTRSLPEHNLRPRYAPA